MYANKNSNVSQHTRETLMAFVDTVIPRTPGLAEEYGEIQYYGALDFLTDEYLIVTLNEYHESLTDSITHMLDAASKQLVLIRGNKKLHPYLNEVTFWELAPDDRLLAMDLLRQNQVAYSHMTEPFKNITYNIIDNLIKLTMMGYYSEWFGYGTTRLAEPNQRILEYYPLSWKQVEYPGPNPSYNF